MSDLINRQQAIDYCEALMNAERLQQTDDWGYGRERYNQTECIMHYIENMPSAQLEPSTAYWKKDVFGTVICSKCGGIRRDNRVDHIQWCNSCGCYMRGEHDDEQRSN